VLGAARSHYLLLFAHPDPPRRPLFPYTTLFTAVRPESAAEAQTLARKYHDFVRSAAKGEHRNPDHAGHLHVVTPAGRRELVYASANLDLNRVAQDLRRLLAAQELSTQKPHT